MVLQKWLYLPFKSGKCRGVNIYPPQAYKHVSNELSDTLLINFYMLHLLVLDCIHILIFFSFICHNMSMSSLKIIVGYVCSFQVHHK